MNILVVNAYPSWASSLEAAQCALGMISARSNVKTPDEISLNEVTRLKLLTKEHKADVVILDNHWMPNELLSISHNHLLVAGRFGVIRTRVFYLNNASPQGADDTLHRRRSSMPPYRTDFDSELWRAFKPVTRCAGLSFDTVRIARFDGQLFESGTGAVKHYSSGDGGAEDVEHWIRIGHAFWERDWPKIVEAVKQELSA